MRHRSCAARSPSLQTIPDLVGPEPFEAGERLVEALDVFVVDLADGFDRGQLALVELFDDVAGVLALDCQADAHRTLVDIGALVVNVAHVDELLQVVGDVGAQIVAPRLQLASRQFAVADVVEE